MTKKVKDLQSLCKYIYISILKGDSLLKGKYVLASLGVLSAMVISMPVAAGDNDKTVEGSVKKQYEVEISNSSGDSYCHYDWGSWLPNDDAYMSVTAKGTIGVYKKAYANLCYENRQDIDTIDGKTAYKYKYVAELSGVDYASYARGIAESPAGLADLKVK